MSNLIYLEGVVTSLGASHQPGSAFWQYENIRVRTATSGETVVRKVNAENDLTHALRSAVSAGGNAKMLFAKIPMFGTTLVAIETEGRSYAPGFVSSGKMSMKVMGLVAIVGLFGLATSFMLLGIPILIGAIYVAIVLTSLASSVRPEMQRRGFSPLATTNFI